jgi:Flp pilus assembly protein TadB
MRLRLKLTAIMACLSCALLTGTVVAFLLYVSVLSIMAVSIIVLALLVAFGLGVQAGGRRIRMKRRSSIPSSVGIAQGSERSGCSTPQPGYSLTVSQRPHLC